MRILLNVLAVTFIGWPALVVGYVVRAITNGYLAGVYIHEQHEKEAINKFIYKVHVSKPKEPA